MAWLFYFGIEPDGVREGVVARMSQRFAHERAQGVAMVCGCHFLYIAGERYGCVAQCWVHEGADIIRAATIINATLACCTN